MTREMPAGSNESRGQHVSAVDRVDRDVKKAATGDHDAICRLVERNRRWLINTVGSIYRTASGGSGLMVRQMTSCKGYRSRCSRALRLASGMKRNFEGYCIAGFATSSSMKRER